MDVTFWGVRGSIAVSGPDTQRVGGNTSCVELRSGDHRLVLDGGTGLQSLGASMASGGHTFVLVSHVHWDHIQGIPFFRPAYDPSHELTLGGQRHKGATLKRALERQMSPPAFPIRLDAFRAKVRFVDLVPGRDHHFGPFKVQVANLVHPQGSTAMRIEADGRSVVYATDHEAGGRVPSDRLVGLAEGADLLIHDAQYTPDEIAGRSGPSKRGWGHSTWEDAVCTAEAADVGLLTLFHHDPARTDDAVAILEAEAQRRFPATLAARERRVVAL